MSEQQEGPTPGEKAAARRETWLRFGALGFVFIVFVGAFAFTRQGGPTERDAERACQQSVEERLKAPSTADFGAVMVSEDGGQWTVRGEVDAENSFGAPIRNTYVCTFETDGDDLSLVDIEISE